jgi:hypothetical protein
MTNPTSAIGTNTSTNEMPRQPLLAGPAETLRALALLVLCGCELNHLR